MTSCSAAARRAAGLGDGLAAASSSAAGRAAGSCGSTRTPASGCDELGRPAVGGRDHGALHRHRLQRRLAERLDQRRLAEHVARRDPVRHLRLRDPPARVTPGRPSSSLAQRPVADEGEPPAAERGEGLGQTDDVLALDQRADAEEGRSLAVPAELAAASSAGRGENASRSTPQSATSIFGSAAGICSVRRPASQRELAITAEERPQHPAGGRGDARDPAQVGDVLAVGHDHQRRAGRAGGEGAGGAGGEEEMGEDDVGTEASCGCPRLADEAHVLRPRAAALADRGDLDLVPQCLDLPRQRNQEAAQVGLLRAGPHLGHLEDPHDYDPKPRLYASAASRMPSPRPGSSAWRACSQ